MPMAADTPSAQERTSSPSTTRKIASRMAGAGTWAVGALTSSTCTLGMRCAWLRALRSMAGVGLKLFPSIYDGQDQHKRQHSSGRIRDRRQTEQLCQRLEEAEEGAGISPTELLDQLGIDRDRKSVLTPEFARDAFGETLAQGPEVAVLYSGGADSTTAAVMATQAFERVHLLTFSHPFIKASDQSQTNAQKLVELFGEDAVIHRQIDVTDAINTLLFGDYLGDLRRYGTAPIGWPCLACKMAFDIGTLRYAPEHGIRVVADGSDLRVSYQLSQGDPQTMAVREEWYANHGISFVHPVAQIEDTVTELLLFGLEKNGHSLLYPRQGHCVGNDMLGTAYKRFYYIPKFGMDHLRGRAIEWARDMIERHDSAATSAERSE